MIVVNVAALVAPGVATRELGIDRGTFVRCWQHGLLIPAVITAAGHARWNLQELHPQLKNRRHHDEYDRPALSGGAVVAPMTGNLRRFAGDSFTPR